MKKMRVYFKNLAYIVVDADTAGDASIAAADILEEQGMSALTLDGDWDECLIELEDEDENE